MAVFSARTPLASCLVATAFILGCVDAEPTAPDDPTQTSSEALDDSAGSVRCTYVYRQSNEVMDGQTGDEPAFQFEERVLRVAADQDASETLGRLTFYVGFHTSEYDTDTVSVRASDGASSLFSILYQLPAGLPRNQFSGGHGFTGLLYFTHPTAGGDYQAFCQSVP